MRTTYFADQDKQEQAYVPGQGSCQPYKLAKLGPSNAKKAGRDS